MSVFRDDNDQFVFLIKDRIVAEVDELMLLCDRLEAQLATTQSETSRLLESVLRHVQDGPSIAQSGRLHWQSARPISVTLP